MEGKREMAGDVLDQSLHKMLHPTGESYDRVVRGGEGLGGGSGRSWTEL